MKNQELIIILGCTATGKTKVAAHLAHELGGEIISADSRQVFKGMDIGTGKDLSEYNIEGKQIPYHLIDNKVAGETYSVYEFQQDFLTAYEEIKSRGNVPILVGGTGLYLDAVVKGYRLLDVPENIELRERLIQKSLEELALLVETKKKVHNTTDTSDKTRAIRAIEIAEYEELHQDELTSFPEIKHIVFGIQYDRPILKERITSRLKLRLKEEGMIEEVERLKNEGVSLDRLKYYGLEYKFIAQYVNREINRQELFEQLNIAIHQFSKRQATWFRRMEKNGVNINWIDGDLPLTTKVSKIKEQLNG